MKPIFSSLALAAGAAGCTAAQQTIDVANPPARTTGAVSALVVPASCPVYVPGDYDIDTPELPYESPVLFGCGVDSTGAVYGMAVGDGGTGAMAVVPGGREIGNFYQFDASVRDDMVAAAALDLDGTTSFIHAYASPTSNVTAGSDCCAENHPEDEIPVHVVAVGTTGLLVSYGQFDTTTFQQIATQWSPQDLFPGHVGDDLRGQGERFYVNDMPQ